MKEISRKYGFFYNSTKKYRAKLALYTLVAFIIFALYFFLCKPYILNVVTGPAKLDYNQFAKDAVLIDIADEVMEKNDTRTIRTYALKNSSYWQGGEYEFDLKISKAHKTPIQYTNANTSDNYNATDDKTISAHLYDAEISGVKVLVLAYPHQKIADNSTISGIFTEIPNIIKTNFASLEGQNTADYYKYMLDTRGIEMESERFDILISALLLLLGIFLFVKLIIYFINPLLTPTYREANKYGDMDNVIDDIEYQLEQKGITKITKNNPAITDDWILTKAGFKYKIEKNYTKPQDSSRYGSRL